MYGCRQFPGRDLNLRHVCLGHSNHVPRTSSRPRSSPVLLTAPQYYVRDAVERHSQISLVPQLIADRQPAVLVDRGERIDTGTAAVMAHAGDAVVPGASASSQ